MTKPELVRLLLLSRHDYLPVPRCSTGRGSAPGPQSSLWVKCSYCSGVGRVVRPEAFCVTCKDKTTKLPHGCYSCPVCDGCGERRRRKGDEAQDAYSGLTLAELAEQKAKESRSRAEPKRRLVLNDSVVDHDEEWWLREKQRYWAAGSYAELEEVLGWLRDVSWTRYEMVRHWSEEPNSTWWSWSDEVMERIDESIRMIAKRMPEPIRVPRFVRAAYEFSRREARRSAA